MGIAGAGLDLGLAGKKAVVTGASRGIGRAIALALINQGVIVALVHRTASGASRDLAAEIGGGQSFIVEADVADEASVVKLADTVAGRLERVDILVNNAGVVGHRNLSELDLDEWRRVVDTNLTGTYLVTRAMLPLFNDGGAIVNVGSAVAMVGQAGMAHYTASKAGLHGLTRSLAKELGVRRIRVNSIAPGVVETDQAAGMPAERRAYYVNRIPLARLGEPEDVAGVCLFLVSPLAAYVDGVNQVVDGGI
jgi:NAD(P)-dependent dehydrogenase (short-subunit alcohol dehydrogenase family)